MSTLHLVSRVEALASCRSLAASEDIILLIEEGVLAAAHDHHRAVLALREDLAQRGYLRLGRNVESIGRDQFVALVVRHQPIVSWR